MKDVMKTEMPPVHGAALQVSAGSGRGPGRAGSGRPRGGSAMMRTNRRAGR